MNNNIYHYIKALFFTLLIIASLTSAFAQQRNLFFNSFDNVVRLDFSTSPPTPFPTGIAGSYEGIAHYEDGNGNLLFWFNSTGVFDAFNNFMNGSTGIFANSSSAEINICPVPGNPNQYYIIYNEETCSSLWYSTVDMSLNGGLGDVIDLNTSIDFADFSEGIEIVRIPCTNHYWLIGYQCGTGFKRFLIDENGINPGTIIHPYPMPPGGTYDGRGETDYHNGKLGACFAWVDNVFLADFDPTTGILTNPITLNDPAFQTSPFGVDFSPSGNKMYFTLWYTTFAPNVFQYDIASGTLTSYTAPGSNFITGLGEIELGRDGKLYLIQDGGSDIVVIENPDDDIPIFSSINIPFPGGFGATGLGISDHIQSDIFEIVNTLTDTLCIKIGEAVTLTPPGDGIDFEWANAADTTNILHTGPDFTHNMNNTTEVFIATSIGNAQCFDIVEYTLVPFPDINVSADITISEGESTTLNANTTAGDNDYIWFPGNSLDDPFSASPVATPDETTTYFVSVHNDVCYVQDTIVVTVVEDGVVYDTLCFDMGASADLVALDTMSNVTWATSDDPTNVIGNGSSLSINIDAPITYIASGDTPIGASMDYIITVYPIPNLDAGLDVTITEGESIQLSASGGGNGGYAWLPDDGSLDALDIANPIATPTQTTSYFVSSYYHSACPSNDDVTVTVVMEFDRVDSLCAVVGQPLELLAPDILSNVTWALAGDPSNILASGTALQIQNVLAEETIYLASGKDSQGNTINTYITVYPNPPINAGGDITLNGEGSVQLSVTGGDNYAWEPADLLDDPTSSSPTTNLLTESTSFYVSNTTDRGCVFNAGVAVIIRNDAFVRVPTAFSPNGDGINDELRAIPFNIAELHTFVIYNRWGQKVFETNDFSQGWDGTHEEKLQNTGVYVYMVKAVTVEGREIIEKGNVSMIR